MEVDDISHNSWDYIQTVFPGNDIDYMTSSTVGSVEVEIKNTQKPSLCWDTVTIQIVDPALPVTWVASLRLTPKDQSIIIEWQIAHQINNEKFIIEHSKDDSNFKYIG